MLQKNFINYFFVFVEVVCRAYLNLLLTDFSAVATIFLTTFHQDIRKRLRMKGPALIFIKFAKSHFKPFSLKVSVHFAAQKYIKAFSLKSKVKFVTYGLHNVSVYS